MTAADASPAIPDPASAVEGRPLSPVDLIVLNDEMRSFVRAGIPLDVGLQGTAGRTSGRLRDLSERLAGRLAMGTDLEAAISEERGTLPETYAAVLSAGLKTGRLDDVLESLSDIADATSTLSRQLRVALIYPAIVCALAYALFTGFILFVVPQLQRTYVMFDLKETAWVRMLSWLHASVAVWGIAAPLLVLLVLVGTWGLRLLTERGTDRPPFPMNLLPGGRDLAVARFARVFSLLVQHEVPLPEACRLSGRATGDLTVRDEAQRLALAVEGGQSLEEAIDGRQQLPAFLRWLIAVGNRQGTLASSLRQAAGIYEQRALTKLEWFRRVVPPLIVVLCCGGITLLYGLTLFLPLAELIGSLGLG